ncbi:MAG: N-acetylmuramoyl-L-alanine amidase [Clostridia bacterium]|nr:N-acetylmuramoyl-L-alanine amidase [Clostridia bacterium]
MKKARFIIGLILIFIISSISAYAKDIYYNNSYHVYDAKPIELYVNNVKLTSLPMDPVIIDGTTLVPVREVFEAMGCTVKWHSESKQAEIVRGGDSILVKIGSRNAYLNGNLIKIKNDQPYPMLIGYSQAVVKTMVPIRFIAESLKYNVEWKSDTRRIYISNKSTSNNNPDQEVIEEGYGEFSKVTVNSDYEYDYVYIKTKYGISPKVSRYVEPDRLVFDFKDAKFTLPTGSVNIDGNCFSKVRYANHEGSARLVLDLTEKNAQVMVLSNENGIVIRVERSLNTQIIYDAFAEKIYFNAAYAGSGKDDAGGYKVTFSNLKMEEQIININDSIVNNIVIKSEGTGSSITVNGNKRFSYTQDKGIIVKEEVVPPDKEENTKPSVDNSKPLIILDAGHGGTDPGAVGYNSKNEIVARESKINMAITNLVKEKVIKQGYNVILTRSGDDYISLSDRVAIEKSHNADMFVSIHCNSIDKSEINGTQVYYHASSEKGAVLAKNIYESIVELTNLAPKKTQNGAHLYVIRETVCPAVIVETAFISNESDRNYLLSSEGQQTIAEAIFRGIKKTIENK